MVTRVPHTTHILGLGEDWCPDVHGNLPVVARMASLNPEKLVLRIFPRDEQDNGESPPYADVPRSPEPSRFKNHDLMAHYLHGKNQSMSIPAFGFFDEKWNEFGKFTGGRPKLYWHWIDKMGKQEAIQNRMGEFARHNYGREMFWEIRRLLATHAHPVPRHSRHPLRSRSHRRRADRHRQDSRFRPARAGAAPRGR